MIIISFSSWLKNIHDLKIEDRMTYCEAADRLRAIADHYDWYGKERLNEMVDDALRDDSNAM